MTFEIDIDFQEDLGGNLAPFWHRKSTKILPKSDPKRHQNSARFSGRFFLDFGSDLAAKTGPRQAQEAATTGKTGPRGRQDGPKRPPRRPQEGPKKRVLGLNIRYWPPRASQGPPGPLQERFLVHFWSIFDGFLVDFWSLFHRLFGLFSLVDFF